MTARRSATRYALLLRGINVGTKNSLPMAELRAMLEATGCTQVATYVQSGNAVFETRLGAAALGAAIERRLEERMGRPIATTLRTAPQLEAILAGNPFPEAATEPSRLCVTFLANVPTTAEVAPLSADFGRERVLVVGTEIYTWHPDGQSRSPLAEALGKLRLRGAVTTRNWNTVQKLAAMLAAR